MAAQAAPAPDHRRCDAQPTIVGGHPMTIVDEVIAAARKAAASLEAPLEAMALEIAKLPPLPPRPEPLKMEPELLPSALAYQQMLRLQQLMGGRSPAAYAKMAKQRKDILIAEIKDLARHSDDLYYEMGARLHVLRENKPENIRWGDYLKQMEVPCDKRQADEYIQVFLGMTTALEIKAAERKRKRPAKKKTACDIDWEHHQESPDEGGAEVRKRAVTWQLHEATRLADEFALRRPGTQSSEISLTTVRKINSVINAWKKLHKEMLTKAGK
jgi:hypothetical protein